MTPITPKPDLDAIQKQIATRLKRNFGGIARISINLAHEPLVAYTRTLQERVAELERDKERLDLLESQWLEEDDPPIMLLDDGFIPSLSGVWKKGRTLREALDDYGKELPATEEVSE